MKKIPLLAKLSLLLLTSCVVLFFVVRSCGRKQTGRYLTPSSFKTLTIYRTPAAGTVIDANDATLEKIPHFTLNEDITQKIFGNVTYRKGILIWKGGGLAIAKTKDGTEKRIAIDFIGNRKFDILREKDYGYYVIEGESGVLLNRIIRQLRATDFAPIPQETLNLWASPDANDKPNE